LWIASAILAVVYLIGAFASSDPRDPFAYLLWEIRSVLQISVPILFLWGLLSTRLARSAVGDLVLELDRSLPPGELRSTLARSIGDPTLELVYALQDGDRWVGPDGQPVTLPDRGHGHAARAITIVERDDQPVAALIHDPGLDEGLVRAAGAAAGMSIENERLHAEVRAQLEEVRASRQRIVEAGDRERRRVERNLHDGAQQRLVSLSLALAMLRDRDGVDTATVSELEGASDLLKQAIVELRELARGIHPAILSDEGLAAAVDSLADRSSIPVRIRAAVDERLPERIEATAYFVVAESLANVTKYAEASSAVVAIARRNGSLHIEVVDDGVGGADVTRGSGLRGLADRVAAVGGTLRVDSPLGQGTVIMAEMPLDA
jgi:signal transduction histidine kinase